MIDTGYAQLQPQVQQPAYQQTPTMPDPASEAERILDVGDRWGPDDFEARLEEFANTMQEGDAVFRQQLMNAILERDTNAPNSWLNPEIIANETGSRITGEQRAIIGEAFAGAYNAGHPSLQSIEVPADSGPGAQLDQTRQQNPLDGALLNYHTSGSGDFAENAERANAFVDLINSSQGPEASQFRQDYSQHLIDEYVLNDAVDPLRRDAAAGIAAQLLTGDAVLPDHLAGSQSSTAVDVLHSLDESGDLGTFLDHVERSNGLFGREILEGAALNSNRDVDDLAMSDGLSELMSAVARDQRPESAELAIEFARLPESNADWFEGDADGVAGDRNLALSSAFAMHSDAVLDELTVYDRGGAGNPDDPNQQNYSVNVDTLGSLMETIMFNPDASVPGVVRDRVLDYAGGLTNEINTIGAEETNADGEQFHDLAGRLAVLSAGTSDAIGNQWQGIKEDQEARAAAIGFVVDMALVAVPIGDLADGQIKSAIADALPEGRIRTAVEGLSGQIVSEATGQLTAEAKQQLSDALGDDAADVIEQSAIQDGLEEALVSNIENSERRFDIVERADRLVGDS